MFEEVINWVNSILWSDAMIVLCMGLGIYFSVATRFLQVTHIKDMVRLLFGGGASSKGYLRSKLLLLHFQAG